MEDIMRATTNTKSEVRTDIGYEVSRFSLGVGIAMASLVGLWGFACMIGGLATNGTGELLKGFLTAVTGG